MYWAVMRIIITITISSNRRRSNLSNMELDKDITGGSVRVKDDLMTDDEHDILLKRRSLAQDLDSIGYTTTAQETYLLLVDMLLE